MRVTPPLLIAAVAGLAISVALDLLLIDREHVHAPFPYADVPGAWVLFGLIWCVALIFVPKWVGHLFLMREEDPYTGEPVRDEWDQEELHE